MASKPRLSLGPSLSHLVSGMMGMRNGEDEERGSLIFKILE